MQAARGEENKPVGLGSRWAAELVFAGPELGLDLGKQKCALGLGLGPITIIK